MKKRTRLILIISMVAVLLCVLAIMFFNSDVWEFICYKHFDCVPTWIETVLIDVAAVEDGELFTEEELSVFFDDWVDGEFNGYYDSMPDNLRRLTDSFVERINKRYTHRNATGSMIKISPPIVQVTIDPNEETIDFYFLIIKLQLEYKYTQGILVSKWVGCPVPDGSSNSRYNTTLPDFDLRIGGAAIHYTPETVTLSTPPYRNFQVTMVKQIPTADFDEYMRAVKAGDPGADNPGDKLSLDRIEKHMASKRK